MTYEFDYDTEKVLNQYCLKKTFYRAEEMRIDYNDLASPMELDENYIKGELWQPVKTWKWLWNKKPDQVLPADTLTYNITGKVLYIGTYDHQISQIILKGRRIPMFMIQQRFVCIWKHFWISMKISRCLFRE